MNQPTDITPRAGTRRTAQENALLGAMPDELLSAQLGRPLSGVILLFWLSSHLRFVFSFKIIPARPFQPSAFSSAPVRRRPGEGGFICG